MLPQLFLTLVVAVPPGAAADIDAAPSRSLVAVPHALVSPVREARIPALRPGRLIAFDANEGDDVDQGQSLARFDAQEAEARALAAREAHLAALVEASSDLKIQASEHATRLAEIHRRLTAEVVAEMPRAVTAVEREQTVVRHEQSILETALQREAAALASHQAEIRGAEARLAEIDLSERSLSAPFAGVVVERFAKEHEWVQQGEPVLHLVQMETLQVEAFLEMAEAAPGDVGDRPARLAVAVGPIRTEVFSGKVSFVSPILEADGAYRVRVEIENRLDRGVWLLRPGMVGRLEISLPVEVRPEGDVLATVAGAAVPPSPVDSESTDVEEGRGEESSSKPDPAEDLELDSPEAARLELVIDDEIVAALAEEGSGYDEEPSVDRAASKTEGGDDADR